MEQDDPCLDHARQTWLGKTPSAANMVTLSPNENGRSYFGKWTVRTLPSTWLFPCIGLRPHTDLDFVLTACWKQKKLQPSLQRGSRTLSRSLNAILIPQSTHTCGQWHVSSREAAVEWQLQVHKYSLYCKLYDVMKKTSLEQRFSTQESQPIWG